MKEKALCSQAEKPACPERHKLYLEGKNRQGGISGGFLSLDGGPKILRVRNVDSWHLRCGSAFMEPLIVFLPSSLAPTPPETPRELSSSHSDPEDLAVGYHNSRPVDRKSKLREELRIREAQAYAHLVQQVAVRVRS